MSTDTMNSSSSRASSSPSESWIDRTGLPPTVSSARARLVFFMAPDEREKLRREDVMGLEKIPVAAAAEHQRGGQLAANLGSSGDAAREATGAKAATGGRLPRHGAPVHA